VPEFVELTGIEKCDRCRHLAIAHREIPGVGIAIRKTVCGCGGRIERLRVNSAEAAAAVSAGKLVISTGLL
jgi:hypothetical protein